MWTRNMFSIVFCLFFMSHGMGWFWRLFVPFNKDVKSNDYFIVSTENMEQQTGNYFFTRFRKWNNIIDGIFTTNNHRTSLGDTKNIFIYSIHGFILFKEGNLLVKGRSTDKVNISHHPHLSLSKERKTGVRRSKSITFKCYTFYVVNVRLVLTKLVDLDIGTFNCSSP